MKLFKADSTGLMAQQVYTSLTDNGVYRGSRNGDVIQFPYPVALEYTRPLSRCNFTQGRDANPVFHHMEALWMLAGRQDVNFLTMFNANMIKYSDDGLIFNAPYGYRIRHHFGFDQLEAAISTLREDSQSRQAVIQIWDSEDLCKITKDKACNMQMVFSIDPRRGRVNLTVYNRSNDAVFGGVSGANPVHFSYFLQYVANQLGRPVGSLYFFVNNLHVYLDLYDHWEKMNWETYETYPYTEHQVGELEEIEYFCDSCMLKNEIVSTFDSPMLDKVSKPMWNYWQNRKYGDGLKALGWADQINSMDWSMAIHEWHGRRVKLKTSEEGT